MTSDASIERAAGRVIVVDGGGRTLLFRGGDPARPAEGTWWFTPGGGADDGETTEAAARRELFEETGLHVDDLGPVVATRSTTFEFKGRRYRQREDFYRIVVSAFDVETSGWTDVERETIEEHRWWTRDELASTTERVFPENLAELIVEPLL